MFDVAIYAKTARGREEVSERRLGLPARLRRALILIDGRTNFGTLRLMLEPLGDPKDIVQQLSELGLVESDYDLPPMPVIGGQDEQDAPSAVQPIR